MFKLFGVISSVINKNSLLMLTMFSFALYTSFSVQAEYQRNKAVPVERVDFGRITSVREITQTELIKDQSRGWKVFGGALIGGVIGHHVGGVVSDRQHSRTSKNVGSILGAIIGASVANENQQKYHEKVLQLVELMIKTEDGTEYMVIQDLDVRIKFEKGTPVRIIYLASGSVRVDPQL